MTTIQLKQCICRAAQLLDADLVFPDDPSSSVREFYLTVWTSDVETIPAEDQPYFVDSLFDEARTLNKRFRARQKRISISKAKGAAKAISGQNLADDRRLAALLTVAASPCLIQANTGSGKSALLRSLIASNMPDAICEPVDIESKRQPMRRDFPVRRGPQWQANRSQLSFDFGDTGVHPLLVDSSGVRYPRMWRSTQDRQHSTGHTPSEIRVIGVGGAGCRFVELVSKAGLEASSIAINTNKATLDKCEANVVLQLGESLTNGFGTGSNPEVGRKAAESDATNIRKLLVGADLVIVAVGLGGGTGSGATPVITQIARDLNILTMALVTTPLEYEAQSRFENAKRCLSELEKIADSLMVVPNLGSRCYRYPSPEGFGFGSDQILSNAMRGVSELFHRPGMSHLLSIAEIRSKFATHWGHSVVGLGSSSGFDRAQRALKDALQMWDLSSTKARVKNILVSLACDESLTMEELEAIDAGLRSLAAPGAYIMGGASYDRTLNGELRLAVLAGGIESCAA